MVLNVELLLQSSLLRLSHCHSRIKTAFLLRFFIGLFGVDIWHGIIKTVTYILIFHAFQELVYSNTSSVLLRCFHSVILRWLIGLIHVTVLHIHIFFVLFVFIKLINPLLFYPLILFICMSLYSCALWSRHHLNSLSVCLVIDLMTLGD